MKTSTLTSVILIITLASCTPHLPGSPAPEQFPETPAKSNPPIRTTPQISHWSFTHRHSTNDYRSTTETVITQLEGSSTRRDSTQTRAEFTLDVNNLVASTNISGQITSLDTNRNTTLHSPLAFSATISSGQLRLEPTRSQPDDELCSTDANQSLGEIRSALYSLPMQLDSDTTWSDSTTTSTCSGKKVPTTLQIVRSYKVIGESNYNGQPVLLLNREDQIRLTGQGAQQQHQLQLKGSGTAVSRISIDFRTGLPLAVETTQQLQITIQASGQFQTFRQTTRQEVHAIR